MSAPCTCSHARADHDLDTGPCLARNEGTRRLFCPCEVYESARRSPVTASDARPPSDTGTTGWHVHPWGSAHKDDEPCMAGESRPVLVVDPAEARETIARASHEAWAHMTDNPAEEYWAANERYWTMLADAVLAALAGQGQP